jgi:hypothetical protein
MSMPSHINDDTAIALNQEIRIGSTVIEVPDRLDQNEARRLFQFCFISARRKKITLVYSYGLVLRVR